MSGSLDLFSDLERRTAAEVLARARANAGVTNIPARSSAMAPPDAGEGPLNDREGGRPGGSASPALPGGNKAPLERPDAHAALAHFAELAEEFRREAGYWPPGHANIGPDDGISDGARAQLWIEWLAERRKAAAPPPPKVEAPPAPIAVSSSSAPGPLGRPPTLCKDCGAAVIWCAILAASIDPRDGSTIWVRQKRENGKGWKSMPIDWQPDPDGRVVVFRRSEAGESKGYVCRVLKKGEAPPEGARLRTSHFATCTKREPRRRR